MRITDIDVFIPMVGSRTQCLVRIETDSGIYGWGESGLSGREHAVAGALKHFRSFLLGQDPLRRGFLWQRLYRSQYFEGGRVLLAAQSAIDIALHDICGKALGVPVYELLGGRQRDWVPLFATTAASPGPGLIADVEALIAAGWDVVRFVPGTPDDSDPDRFEPRASLALTAEWATRLRDAVGPAPTLGIDWHHRLTVAETASFSARMPRGTLDFLEEPIRAQSPDSYAQLRRLVDIPLAIGEEFASKWDFAPYLERGLTEFVRLDIANVGGFSEALKVAGWAETHYLEVMPHHPLGPVCGAATAHLCMAIPNLSWMEFQRSPIGDLGFYDERLFPIQPRQEGPRLYVQEVPGLGVEVDMSVLRESEALWNPPQFHRSDGSVQNW